MKKILLLLMLLINVTAFADECALPRHSFTYVKLDTLLITGNPTSGGGGFGIGRRFEQNGHAFDLSFAVGFTPKSTTIALPKIMYLVIQDPLASRSLYWGGGLSWGGIHNRQMIAKRFSGLVAEFVVGMDLERHCNARPFVELTLSQPLIATNNRYSTILPPAITLGYGIGF